jgi:4-hydroxyphenylpyruvate dioxygenase
LVANLAEINPTALPKINFISFIPESVIAMTDQNPMGLDGFEFVEFSSPERGQLEPTFEALGFSLVATHRSKAVHLWRQGSVNFIINYEPRSTAWYYAEEHGPSACGMAFRVKDAHQAYHRALELGAQPIEIPTGPMELRLPAIRGIGGTPLYLIDRYDAGTSIYDIDFEYLDDVDRYPKGIGLSDIDHLTHNVYRGRMNYWAGFYEKYFNFREIRQFDIHGAETGLVSRAMTAPDNKIRIPLNEEARGTAEGQIEEFLMQYNGEGIQHIALSCHNIAETIAVLKARGIPMMTPPPESYYDMLDERLPNHGIELEQMKQQGILIDGTTEDGSPRILLQIFSETLVGPIFFEFIERKGDEGFGEGNFQALFEAMERDQLRRGVLTQQGE